jgi:hypothetical protein
VPSDFGNGMSSYPQRSDQMLEEENEGLENNLSNKVQALKSVGSVLHNLSYLCTTSFWCICWLLNLGGWKEYFTLT